MSLHRHILEFFFGSESLRRSWTLQGHTVQREISGNISVFRPNARFGMNRDLYMQFETHCRLTFIRCLFVYFLPYL